MIEGQTYQITTNMKLRYSLHLILFPVLLPIIFFSRNILLTILAVIIFLWSSKILLDLPNSVPGWNPYTMFKPFATFRNFIKMFRQNEDDLNSIPKLNLIFSISIPFYFLYVLIQYSITLGLLFLLLYTILF